MSAGQPPVLLDDLRSVRAPSRVLTAKAERCRDATPSMVLPRTVRHQHRQDDRPRHATVADKDRRQAPGRKLGAPMLLILRVAYESRCRSSIAAACSIRRITEVRRCHRRRHHPPQADIGTLHSRGQREPKKVLIANRGDRPAYHPRAGGDGHTEGRSTPARTRIRCLSGWPMKRSPSAAPSRRQLPEHRGADRRRASNMAATPSIPATASCPRTRTSQACIDAGIVFIGRIPARSA